MTLNDRECNLVNTGKSGNPGQTCMVLQRLGSISRTYLGLTLDIPWIDLGHTLCETTDVLANIIPCAASLRGPVPITARPWRIQRAFPCSGPQSELCTESKACFRLVSNILRTLSHHLSKHCGQTSVLQHVHSGEQPRSVVICPHLVHLVVGGQTCDGKLLRKTGVVEAIVMMASKRTEQMVEGDKDASTCRCVEISALEFQHI
ncbi:hypothetical protein BDZ97DRAFT_1858135 [Flammula alnicola]|nr:hypothetical protein BDZ97DRAFT_1858135 [Flammula alnicola]